MSKTRSRKDVMQDKLCKELGDGYCIRFVDFERCIYRELGNGFNVEISGMHTSSTTRRATLYLWFGAGPSSVMVRIIQNAPRDEIGSQTEALFEYSQMLISKGYTDARSLYRMIQDELHDDISINYGSL